ncbi:MAG: hypothetical protein AAGG68_09755 [Bacteroidota bacterium]
MNTINYNPKQSKPLNWLFPLLLVMVIGSYLFIHQVNDTQQKVTESTTVTSVSASPMPKPPGKDKYSRWKGKNKYKGKCNQKDALSHILCGHSFKSKIAGKSKFLKEFSNKKALKNIGNQVYGQGTWSYQGASKTWKIVLDMGKTIGKDLAGNPSSIVQLIVNSKGEILTMFVL